jgi:hypothetical protein
MRPCIRAALLAAIALATVLLGTCSDTNLVALLTSEVKRANNKFLVIQSVTPTELIDVNPGVRWIVTFDREIDTTTVSAATVKIEPATGITPKFTFSPDAKILYVEAEPFLADTTAYMITITAGVRAADGSDMELERSWSFTTGIYPAGTVAVNGGAALTNSETVSLTLYCNDAAEFYSVATDEAGLTSWTSISTWPTTIVTPFMLTSGGGDGEYAAYVKLKQGGGTTAKYSVVKSDTIILDKTAPTVDAGTQRWTNTTYTVTPAPSASDLHGIASYAWSCTEPAVTFTPSNVASPAVGVSAVPVDGNYTLTLTVTDGAGNTAADTMILTKDVLPPSSPPTVDAGKTTASPTTSLIPSWYWVKGSSSGGETVPIYRIILDGTTLYDKSTKTYYRPGFKPPEAAGLADGAHRLIVRETDYAGNLSAAAFDVTINVVPSIPISESGSVSTTPTLRWHRMYDRYGVPVEFYVVHLGTMSGTTYREAWRSDKVPYDEKVDPSVLVDMVLKPDLWHYWYVEGVGRETIRSPSRDYYSFFTGKL